MKKKLWHSRCLNPLKITPVIVNVRPYDFGPGGLLRLQDEPGENQQHWRRVDFLRGREADKYDIFFLTFEAAKAAAVERAERALADSVAELERRATFVAQNRKDLERAKALIPSKRNN